MFKHIPLCKKFGRQTNCFQIGRLSSINSEETYWELVCQVCLEYQWEKRDFANAENECLETHFNRKQNSTR